MDIAAGNIRGAISQHGANYYTINYLQCTWISEGATRLDVDVTTLRCVENISDAPAQSDSISETQPEAST
jgi:hypothetical protein